MSSKKKNIYIYLGKVILITLLIVLFVRSFLVESYSISSSQMEATLLDGDEVLIDKTAYGVRLPITLLSIPFTFDTIMGVRSYSSLLELPYKRLFTNRVGRNDIVLFNNPLEINKPLDKQSLLISRCVALPGDIIRMKNNRFFINDNPYMDSPSQMKEYVTVVKDKQELENTLDELDISLHDSYWQSDTLFMQLSRYDAFVLNEYLSDSLKNKQTDTIAEYAFLIPFKGKIIDLNENNLIIYKQIILKEQQGKAKIEDGKLVIGNAIQNDYTFEDDYYWVLSDNTISALDSRSLGFIPFRNIIGKARLIWYSSYGGHLRSNRCFLSVK